MKNIIFGLAENMNGTKLTDREKALIIAKRLEAGGYGIVNIDNIEAGIKWLREKGLVKE